MQYRLSYLSSSTKPLFVLIRQLEKFFCVKTGFSHHQACSRVIFCKRGKKKGFGYVHDTHIIYDPIHQILMPQNQIVLKKRRKLVQNFSQD